MPRRERSRRTARGFAHDARDLAALFALSTLLIAVPVPAARASEPTAAAIQRLDDQGARQIVVVREPGVPAAVRAAGRDGAGVDHVANLRLPDTEVVEAQPGRLAEALRALQSEPGVRYAEPDVPVHATTNDPQWPWLWGLQNTGGPIRAIVDFVSNMYTFNGLLSLQWNVLADALRHLILPAVALGTIPLAIIARITRSSLLEVLGLDYVRTARAKGLAEPAVVRKHGLPNAMLPVVTIVGLQVGGLLAGAVLTETIFNLAGVGRALYDAITSHDFAVIQGFVLVIAIGFLVVNLIVDISYAFLDPRIRLS